MSEDTPDGVVELCAFVHTADGAECPIPFPFIVLAEFQSRGMRSMTMVCIVDHICP